MGICAGWSNLDTMKMNLLQNILLNKLRCALYEHSLGAFQLLGPLFLYFLQFFFQGEIPLYILQDQS